MRPLLLKACTISVFSLFATAAISQPIADLYRSEVCSSALREVYQKRIRETRTRDASDLVQYDWCKANVGSEQEARDHGFDLEVVYETLNITTGTTDRWSRAREWMNVNCGSILNQSMERTASSSYIDLMDADVAKQALVTFGQCVNGPDTGQYCSAEPVPGSRNAAMFYVRFRHLQADKPAPKVVSSTVSGARVVGAGTGNQSVFPPGTVVTPLGISALAARDNPNADVHFVVNMDEGVGNCAKTVAGGPAYTVVVRQLSVVGDRVSTKEFKGEQTVRHCSRHCGGGLLNIPVEVKPDPGYSLDITSAGSVRYESDPNPHMVAAFQPGNVFRPPAHLETCWTVLQDRSTARFSLAADGRAVIEVKVNECEEHPEPNTINHISFINGWFQAACHWARAGDCHGGLGKGTPIRAWVKGKKVEQVATPRTVNPINNRRPSDGPVEIDLPTAPPDLTNLRLSFDVVVLDPVRNVSYSLTDQKLSDGQALASPDMQQRKLKISLPP